VDYLSPVHERVDRRFGVRLERAKFVVSTRRNLSEMAVLNGTNLESRKRRINGEVIRVNNLARILPVIAQRHRLAVAR